MKRRIVIIAVFLICFMTNVMAQNSIDKLVDEYSAAGTSSYTSVVDRDPNTLKVRNIINVLSLENADAGKFISAFKRESRTGNFTENTLLILTRWFLRSENKTRAAYMCWRVQTHIGPDGAIRSSRR